MEKQFEKILFELIDNPDHKMADMPRGFQLDYVLAAMKKAYELGQSKN